MPTFVSLINLTEQGVRTIKDDVNRVNVAGQIGQGEGIKILAEWWTMGPYDAVMITEAPDEETISRFLLGAGRKGNIRTMTMRAFSKEEMTRIIQRLA